MLIAQISDTHLLPRGEIAFDLVDTAATLAAAVQAVNAAKPDIVFHTGDLAHHGLPAAYALAREILSGLKAPLYAIPGNHDDRANMRAAFQDAAWMPAKTEPGAFIHYTIDAGPLTIIALDSTIPGEVGGELCDERLDWLAAALVRAGSRPTLLALHHPPLTSGLEGFSKTGLGNSDRLALLLAEHPQIVRVLAGHIHRSFVGMCGPVPVVVGPSASYPFAFDTADGAPLSISFEHPGLAMHLWRPDQGLVSHVISIGGFPSPRPLPRSGRH